MIERPFRLAAATTLAVALSLPAAGQDLAGGTEMVFREGQISNVATGRAVVYEHERRLPAPAEEPDGGADSSDGRIVLSLVERGGAEAGRAALLTIEEDAGRTRRLDPFPGGENAGNPVLLAFLEFTTRAVSDSTGGNPFYIRNRIKDAFREGGETAAAEMAVPGREATEVTRIAYRPFTDDPNEGALGAFSDLVITFEVAETVPGGFVSLEATTGGEDAVYLDRIAYAGETEAGTEEERGDRQ